MPTKSGLDYHLKMSLEAGPSSKLTQKPAFKELSERVVKLTLAMESNFKNHFKQLQQELGLRSRRGSQERREDQTEPHLDRHSGHGSVGVGLSTIRLSI